MTPDEAFKEWWDDSKYNNGFHAGSKNAIEGAFLAAYGLATRRAVEVAEGMKKNPLHGVSVGDVRSISKNDGWNRALSDLIAALTSKQ